MKGNVSLCERVSQLGLHMLVHRWIWKKEKKKTIFIGMQLIYHISSAFLLRKVRMDGWMNEGEELSCTSCMKIRRQREV